MKHFIINNRNYEKFTIVLNCRMKDVRVRSLNECVVVSHASSRRCDWQKQFETWIRTKGEKILSTPETKSKWCFIVKRISHSSFQSTVRYAFVTRHFYVRNKDPIHSFRFSSLSVQWDVFKTENMLDEIQCDKWMT